MRSCSCSASASASRTASSRSTKAPPCDAHVATGLITAGLLLAGLVSVRAWEPRILGAGSGELQRLVRAVAGSAVATRPRRARAAGRLDAAVGVRLAADLRGVRPGLPVRAAPVAAPPARPRPPAAAGARRRQRRGRRRPDPAHPPRPALRLERRRASARRRAPAPTARPHVEGVPVVGDLSSVPGAVREAGYRVVAVAPSPGWGPRRLHELAWQLEGTNTELAVNPGLMEIAGPRLHITPVDGLPLVRLTQPRFTGGRRVLKNAVDRVGAAFALLAISPLLLAIALAVRSDGGPAFYLQERVGVGRPAVPDGQVPVDAGERRPRGRRARRAQRGRRAAVQDAHRPARHPRRRRPAPLLPRRAAAAVQRAHRLDVARRAAPAAAPRGRGVRPTTPGAGCSSGPA